jgi:hypothetical protein
LNRPLNFIIDTGATTTVISKAAVQRIELAGLKIKGETIRVIGAAGVRRWGRNARFVRANGQRVEKEQLARRHSES